VREAWLIIPGVLAAALGGEVFVRSTVGGALRAKIAPGIVAATVAAFATSSPELSVAVNAATADRPEVALGDALGSNVVNIGLVLALAILMGGVTGRREDLRRDIPTALGAPVLVLLLGVDGRLSQVDGAVLLASFSAWLIVTLLQAARERSRVGEVLADRTVWQIARDGIVGILLLVLAGRLIVLSASDFGELLGWDIFVVGAVLVAVATSTPELATVVIARLRGHDEVSVGTVLGSNIFNGLLVIGVAAVITPIEVAGTEVAIAIAAGVITMLLAIPGSTNRLPPLRGVLLLGVCAGYFAAVVLAHGG
jgi:cation:H+ antiporter